MMVIVGGDGRVVEVVVYGGRGDGCSGFVVMLVAVCCVVGNDLNCCDRTW